MGVRWGIINVPKEHPAAKWVEERKRQPTQAEFTSEVGKTLGCPPDVTFIAGDTNFHLLVPSGTSCVAFQVGHPSLREISDMTEGVPRIKVVWKQYIGFLKVEMDFVRFEEIPWGDPL